MRKHQSFLEQFLPLYIFTRFIGINQFSYPLNYRKNGKVTFKRSNLAFCIVQTTISAGITLAQVVFLLSTANSKGYLYVLLTNITGITSVIFLILDFVQRKQIGFIIAGLHDIDCVVSAKKHVSSFALLNEKVTDQKIFITYYSQTTRMGTTPDNNKWRSIYSIGLIVVATTFAITVTICPPILRGAPLYDVIIANVGSFAMSITSSSIIVTYLTFSFGALRRYRVTNEHLR